MGVSLGLIRSRPAVVVGGSVRMPHTEASVDWQRSTQRRRLSTLTALALGLSVGVAALALLFHFITVVGLLIWVAVIAIAFRPFVGLCVAYTLCMVFEDGSPDPLMLPGFYLHWGLGATLGIGVSLSPLE